MMLPPLTYTIVRDFQNCPLKVYHRYVLKDQPFEESPELAWGNEVHSHVDVRLNRGYALPDSMIHWEPLFAALRSPPGGTLVAEQKLAMSWGGGASSYWGDAGNGKPFFRGKADCTLVDASGTKAFLFDWKTGKHREEKDELLAQSMLLKANNPRLETVLGSLVWLHRDKYIVGEKHDVSDPAPYHRKAVQVAADMKQMGDKPWPAKPNRLCDWCTVRSCKFNPHHEP